MRPIALALGVAVAVGACSRTRTRADPPAAEARATTGSVGTAPGRTSGPPAGTPPDAGADPGGATCTAPAAAAPPPWYRDGVFYEIFVRSFQDSDGDGVGDLRGVRQRLDYLADLGVTALWLMPIHPSPSTHGYDVTDYRGVNPEYGALEDVLALVQDATTRGIRITIDLVVNHTARTHPWFVKGKRGPDRAESRWYVFRDTAPSPAEGWGKPWGGAGDVWHPAGPRWYYGLFSPDMPDLNLTEPAVREELTSIAKLWVGRGLSGFRLDAARYLVETGPGPGQADVQATHAFWRELRAALGDDVVLIGEVWTDFPTSASYLGAGDELQMVFGFDRAEALRTALRLGTAAPLAAALCTELSAAPTGAVGSFASNHDLDRLATEVGGDADALRLGATLLMTLPGTPFLYYGQELGLRTGSGQGDIGKRLPMRWDATPNHGFTTADSPWHADATAEPAPVTTQLADPQSLLRHYRDLIALRRSHPSLGHGATTRLTATGTGGSLLAYLRELPGDRVLVVANLAKAPAAGVRVTLPDGAVQSLGDLGAREASVTVLEGRTR